MTSGAQLGVIVRPDGDGATAPRHAPDGISRQVAFRIVRSQLLVTVVLATALFGWGSAELAYSAMVGGSICVASSAYLAARMFRVGRDAHPQALLRAFYAGEVVKMALTAVLFLGAIVYLDLNVLVMFLAYLAATGSYWFALATNHGRTDAK